MACPALSLFFEVDRALARDFSLMIQRVGMTSASVYVLTHPQTDRRSFRVLTWLVPICCGGFVAGLCLLESLREHLIYTIVLSLITAFAISCTMSERRGRACSCCTNGSRAGWRDGLDRWSGSQSVRDRGGCFAVYSHRDTVSTAGKNCDACQSCADNQRQFWVSATVILWMQICS